MSKKSCPGKDEGRQHSGRRDSWCQPDVLKAGEGLCGCSAVGKAAQYQGRLYIALEAEKGCAFI